MFLYPCVVVSVVAAGSLPMEGPSVGEPTATEEPGLWIVPVKIAIVKKYNLAVRNDNPAKRYVVDGGI